MYKPEQKNARLLTLVIAGFALVAVAAYFGSLAVEKFRWIFQIVIILAATSALYLWSRYSLMWFSYVVRQRESEDGGALREAESVTVLTGGTPARMPELPAEPDTTPETTPDDAPDAGAGETP